MLDSLYYGNISPFEKAVPTGKEYREKTKQVSQVLEQLAHGLNEGQMEQIRKLQTLMIDTHCMELEAAFRYGFSLGVFIMKNMCPVRNTNFVRQSRTRTGHIQNISYITSLKL